MTGGYVYIMASKRNGTLYTGICGDLYARVPAHREGRGSKFCAKYNVTRLVWFEHYPLYTDAIQRETNIKRWKRAWKLALIEKINPNWDDLFDTLDL
jgi:putative endonuclease